MENKVAKLISEAKEKLEASNKKKQEEHLISLGLVDENKTELKYQKFYSEGAKYDREKSLYYKEVPTAIPLTANEYAEICKYFPLIKEEKNVEKTGAEQTLSGIATTILIIGIISTIICLSTIVFVDSITGLDFSVQGFIITLGVLFSSLITWALLRVISDISLNIRKINNQ